MEVGGRQTVVEGLEGDAGRPGLFLAGVWIVGDHRHTQALGSPRNLATNLQKGIHRGQGSSGCAQFRALRALHDLTPTCVCKSVVSKRWVHNSENTTPGRFLLPVHPQALSSPRDLAPHLQTRIMRTVKHIDWLRLPLAAACWKLCRGGFAH